MSVRRQQPYRKWDPEEFVRAWCSEPTIKAVAARLGRNTADVEGYAWRLRRRGVKLPTKKAARFDVEHLNSIVRELSEAACERCKDLGAVAVNEAGSMGPCPACRGAE